MGFYINQVTLLGRVGRDAEIKDAGTTKVARFSVATSEGGYKKKDGTDAPKVTHWHNIQCWGSLAELAGRLITKGCVVAVTGRITYREYETKEGAKKSVTEIIATDLVLCTTEGEKVAENAPKQATMTFNDAMNSQYADLPPAQEDDLPF